MGKYQKKTGDRYFNFTIFYLFSRLVRNDDVLPREVLEYVASRLLDVIAVAVNDASARNNKVAQALGISGRRDQTMDKLIMGKELLVLEFKYRHRKNAESRAIKEYCNNNPKYKPSTIKKYYQQGIIWKALAYLLSIEKDERISFSKKQAILPPNYELILLYILNKYRDDYLEK